jgi:hypothetical protein
MASKKSTTVSLFILGGASLLTVAYFIWMFLAPPATTAVVGTSIPTELNAGVVASPGFQSLQPFASLPVKIGPVGRPNPFTDFEPVGAAAPANANANLNANANANTPDNTVVLPPVVPAQNSNLNVNQ